jgi:ribosomal protein L4
MKVAVLDIKGNDTGRKAELSKEVFAIEPNNHAVYLDVKQYLANQRQGTHKAKERAEIAGSTRKIKSKKEQERRVQVVSNQVCLKEEDECSVQDLEITVSN